jgi:Restriction endonuclease
VVDAFNGQTDPLAAIVMAHRRDKLAELYFIKTTMPALDFNEIAPAHEGGDRDQFELFARDFLEAEGFEIVRGPDRGPDAGRDLIVLERRQGPGGVSELKWLVTCKHKAGSGSAVSHTDELNLRDRIETHGCRGLIAFYSTVPSSTLATHLAALEPQYELLIYDRERIETRLLADPKGRTLAARYFPVSFQKWIAASQYAAAPAAEPEQIRDRFFLRAPHTDLASAKAEAAARGVLLFVVVYDHNHSTRSRLNYCLGCFMEWETTKRLVDEHFVVAMGPSSEPTFGDLVPKDDPLEECRWIVLEGDQVIKSESVYANSFEGRKRVLSVINKTPSPQSQQSTSTVGMQNVLRLEPSGEKNWVHLPADKYEPNSRFSVSVHFHLFSSERDVFILDFAGFHYARGLKSGPKAPALKINGHEIGIAGSNYMTLVAPYCLVARSAAFVEYDRSFRTPLMNMCAADCDYGDFEVELRYQADGEVRELSRSFELMQNGQLRDVARPRDVPELNDDELHKYLEEGKLTKAQYDALMKSSSADRYIVAYSDNRSPNYRGIRDDLRQVLRALVHQPPQM